MGMSDTAIQVENVSLTFNLSRGGQVGLGRHLFNLITKKKDFEEFPALDDVSFEVKKGGSLAVVGIEGAGKTSLLKLIAGIIVPTEGRVLTKGSVFGVFAEDKGFDPHLSAVENIYAAGALRGYSHEYMKKRVESIIGFAELEGSEQLRLKKFSHDMSLRLALSIALHVKADILLLDEALSPCGEEFRQRCAERIKKMRESGTALVFVSYLPELAKSLCDEAVWIDNGELLMQDTVDNVFEAYNAFSRNL